MIRTAPDRSATEHRSPARAGGWFAAGRCVAAWLAMCCLAATVWAQSLGLEAQQVQVSRSEGVVMLNFSTRLTLPKPVEDALQRGVPLYFVANAAVMRNRWYWRDERITRVQRQWRLSFQPLTNTYRVSFSGLSQSYPTLADAIRAVTSVSHWRLNEPGDLEADQRYYVDFSYQLDTTQLPRPMQIGIGGQSDWSIGMTRSLRVE